MTHPDDEISICIWIRRLVQAGNDVFMSWTHSNSTREAEGRRVAELLGVPSANLFFFGATDGAVCDEIADLVPRFREMVTHIKPDRICCGAFEQGHLDHDATNFILNQVFDGPIYEIPFYHTYITRAQRMNRFSDPRGQEVLVLDVEEQRLKKHIARQYPSQNIWHVLLLHEAWQVIQFQGIHLARSERMRIQDHRDFLAPNHPPRLAYLVSQSTQWQRWINSVSLYQASQMSAKA